MENDQVQKSDSKHEIPERTSESEEVGTAENVDAGAQNEFSGNQQESQEVLIDSNQEKLEKSETDKKQPTEEGMEGKSPLEEKDEVEEIILHGGSYFRSEPPLKTESEDLNSTQSKATKNVSDKDQIDLNQQKSEVSITDKKQSIQESLETKSFLPEQQAEIQDIILHGGPYFQSDQSLKTESEDLPSSLSEVTRKISKQSRIDLNKQNSEDSITDKKQSVEEGMEKKLSSPEEKEDILEVVLHGGPYFQTEQPWTTETKELPSLLNEQKQKISEQILADPNVDPAENSVEKDKVEIADDLKAGSTRDTSNLGITNGITSHEMDRDTDKTGIQDSKGELPEALLDDEMLPSRKKSENKRKMSNLDADKIVEEVNKEAKEILENNRRNSTDSKSKELISSLREELKKVSETILTDSEDKTEKSSVEKDSNEVENNLKSRSTEDTSNVGIKNEDALMGIDTDKANIQDDKGDFSETSLNNVKIPNGEGNENKIETSNFDTNKICESEETVTTIPQDALADDQKKSKEIAIETNQKMSESNFTNGIELGNEESDEKSESTLTEDTQGSPNLYITKESSSGSKQDIKIETKNEIPFTVGEEDRITSEPTVTESEEKTDRIAAEKGSDEVDNILKTLSTQDVSNMGITNAKTSAKKKMNADEPDTQENERGLFEKFSNDVIIPRDSEQEIAEKTNLDSGGSDEDEGRSDDTEEKKTADTRVREASFEDDQKDSKEIVNDTNEKMLDSSMSDTKDLVNKESEKRLKSISSAGTGEHSDLNLTKESHTVSKQSLELDSKNEPLSSPSEETRNMSEPIFAESENKIEDTSVDKDLNKILNDVKSSSRRDTSDVGITNTDILRDTKTEEDQIEIQNGREDIPETFRNEVVMQPKGKGGNENKKEVFISDSNTVEDVNIAQDIENNESEKEITEDEENHTFVEIEEGRGTVTMERETKQGETNKNDDQNVILGSEVTGREITEKYSEPRVEEKFSDSDETKDDNHDENTKYNSVSSEKNQKKDKNFNKKHGYKISKRLEYLSRPKKDFLDEVISERLDGSVPENAPEAWNTIPLQTKVPLGCCPAPVATKRLASNLFLPTGDRDFDLFDQNNMLLPSEKYDAFHDPSLKGHFQKKHVIEKLRQGGFLTESGKATCSIKEINTYRRYQRRILASEVQQQFRIQDEKVKKERHNGLEEKAQRESQKFRNWRSQGMMRRWIKDTVSSIKDASMENQIMRDMKVLNAQLRKQQAQQKRVDAKADWYKKLYDEHSRKKYHLEAEKKKIHLSKAKEDAEVLIKLFKRQEEEKRQRKEKVDEFWRRKYEWQKQWIKEGEELQKIRDEEKQNNLKSLKQNGRLPIVIDIKQQECDPTCIQKAKAKERKNSVHIKEDDEEDVKI